MIRIVDFMDDKGRCDFKAYEKAQVEAGDVCSVCHGFAFNVARYAIPDGPFVCNDCSALGRESGEVCHDHFIRCPHCRKQINVMLLTYRDPDYGIFLWEGEHDLTCPECEKDFAFETHCSYSFRSPPVDKDGTQAGTEVLP